MKKKKLEALRQRLLHTSSADLAQPGSFQLPPQQPDLPFKLAVQSQSELVRFAREQDNRLSSHRQPLSDSQLTEALQHIAQAFDQEALFQGHVHFAELYQNALHQLSRYDLQITPGADGPGSMADRSLAAFWRSYFQVNPAAGAANYFARVETAALLALFTDDEKLFREEAALWQADDRTALFHRVSNFLAAKGFLIFSDEQMQFFTLSSHALGRVLQQFCWFIDNFHQVNQNKYVFTPRLPCELANELPRKDTGTVVLS